MYSKTAEKDPSTVSRQVHDAFNKFPDRFCTGI